jgi:DNA-binding response OmpR family regulator
MKYANNHKILFVGHDQATLQGQSSVLANAGYGLTYSTLQQTLSMIDSERFDGAVLCHSLTSREARLVLSLIRSSAGRIPVIQVYSLSSDPVFRFASPSYHPAELAAVLGFALQDRAA